MFLYFAEFAKKKSVGGVSHSMSNTAADLHAKLKNDCDLHLPCQQIGYFTTTVGLYLLFIYFQSQI